MERDSSEMNDTWMGQGSFAIHNCDSPDVKYVAVFRNGMIAVCDHQGRQIPAMQGHIIHLLRDAARVSQLEAQLAAQTAAVEVLGKVDELLRNDDKLIEIQLAMGAEGVICASATEMHGKCVKDMIPIQRGATIPEALAALVAAAGKDGGK